jgi:Inositol hexakisphosphate
MKPPIPGSYWVVPGRFLAGRYPEAAFRDTGITSFVDLTEEFEGFPPYDTLLEEGIRFTRRAIPDFGCPTPEQLSATLDLIDSELERGEVVYLHCLGGRGRTGTVVGCWLVRHGASGEEALAKIKGLRQHLPHAAGPSPETPEQCDLVRSWSELDR